MRELAAAASWAEPARFTAVIPATLAVAVSPSHSGTFDSGFEDGDGKSSWNTRAC